MMAANADRIGRYRHGDGRLEHAAFGSDVCRLDGANDSAARRSPWRCTCHFLSVGFSGLLIILGHCALPKRHKLRYHNWY
jgi:hypothetical protein